jgi:hypothetical protein
MSFQPVEAEIVRQPSPILAQTAQDFPRPRLPGHAEITPAGDMDFHVVTLPQTECLHHRGGKSYRQAISPFGNLHRNLL